MRGFTSANCLLTLSVGDISPEEYESYALNLKQLGLHILKRVIIKIRNIEEVGLDKS